jgi:transmembrane sensor
LKYPTVFYGHERRVELSGEAYFEVAKNAAKPFKVSVNGINVQVLGTHFNIMGYNDEKEVKTTLLEGSVKLTNKNCTALLKPGEQGVLNHQQTAFNIENVDVDDVVAWKNGFFAFNNEDIQTIMKEISRWYDVDVEFPEKFKRRNFGGTVSRFKDVSQVLNALELTGSIHFKVEERRIIVMP